MTTAHRTAPVSAMGWVIPGLVILTIIGGFVGGVFWLLESGRQARLANAPIPQFHASQNVKMRAFEASGMVVGVSCWHRWPECRYSVRFSAIQMKTNVGLFGFDGPIDVAPIALVHNIREYELVAR